MPGRLPKAWSRRLSTLLTQTRSRNAALAFAAGGLLSLSYVFPLLFICAWVGFVPLLIALRHASPRESYLYGAIAGLALYAGATHWAAEFVANLKNYGSLQSFGIALLYWLYSAQSIGVVAALYVWLARSLPLPRLLIFPVVVVTVCIAWPTLFTTRMGETQSHFIPAVQAIEFTGLYGLDFLIAMVNAALFTWFFGQQEKHSRFALSVMAIVVLAWFTYGLYAAADWKARIASWSTLKVGLVQSNEKPSSAIPPPTPGYTRAYPPEMPITKALVANGAELVIWPETRFKGYFKYPHVQRSFRHAIAELKTPLVFQDSEGAYEGGGELKEFNTATFLDRQGKLTSTYRKIQRIAFGEYVPLGDLVTSWRPQIYSYLGVTEMYPGKKPGLFEADRYSLVPLICYEVAFPILVANAFQGNAQGRILVGVINDTWFGKTRMPYMHGNTSALRAVEHRVPLVAAINNGPSVVIAPDGRFLLRGEPHTRAGYLVDLPYHPTSGGTLFTRYPYWFISTLYVGLGALVVMAIVLTARRKRAVR